MTSIDRTRRALLRAGGLTLTATLGGCTAIQAPRRTTQDTDNDNSGTGPVLKVDDWRLEETHIGSSGSTPMATAAPGGGGGKMLSAAAQSPGGNVGLAAGGSKDVNNFRRNIEEGFLPLPTDIAYEGLFYEYYFDTADGGSCSRLFCPAYSTAVDGDPLSGAPEHYMTVGLNSGLSKSEFERKTLNLVVVLDVSGSMNHAFDRYYYDRFGNRQTVQGETDRLKIDVATESVAALTTHLRDEDRFGMVVFNDGAAVAKPLRDVGRTDMDAIRDHIRQDVQAGGGTRLSAGIDTATDLLDEHANADQRKFETRMMVLTDAMPNLGDTSEGGLHGTLEHNAGRSIHTTFVGVGVDFNSRLIDTITAIQGSNYLSVHSTEEFRTRLDEEFQYLVTPLVYDLSLELDADGYDIQRVYGSTAAEESTGELLRVNTLFPAPKREGRTRGGVVLAKLRKEGTSPTATLRASWTTRTGSQGTATATVRIPTAGEQFETTGIRKALLLARYADLMKNWTRFERIGEAPTGGIPVPPEYEDVEGSETRDGQLGKWERQSTALTVSPAYRERFRQFADHFEREMDAIGDSSLERELQLLRRLANYDGGPIDLPEPTPTARPAD